MWRWLHSLPRAVRSHFHGPGASAGVSVEDKYEVGCSQARCEARQRKASWRPHCKHSDRKGQEEDKGQREEPKTEKINLNQNYGQHSPIEAFGWGGALAIGIQLSQFHSLHEQYKYRRDRDIQRSSSCPLYKVVHALPGIVSATSKGVKKDVLQTDKKRHEDTSNEDIFEFTLHRIEQELLQELAKKAQSDGNHCPQHREPLPGEKPEWAKIVFPTENEGSCLDSSVTEKFTPDISVIKNLSKEFFGSQTEETCSDDHTSSSKNSCCAEKKFNILDITQQVKRRQSLSDGVHWLPTGFSLPRPTFRGDVLRQFDASRSKGKKPSREITPEKRKTQESRKTTCTSNVESLEEVFEDFNRICRDYTGTGKGMIGVQEAEKGNMRHAVELWEESGMLGNTKALYNLGLCYETGNGVEKNIGEAVKYYTLAAEANHPESLYNLGLVYMEGSHGFPRDQKHGLAMVQQAADQGLAEAIRYLGVFYADEEEDWESAVHYFKLAANQKDKESQYYLGLCYEEGCGVEENTCKAAHYYKLAADQGHDEAQYRLAQFHLHGLGGLPVNTDSGIELLQAAADGGHQEARVDLQRLQGGHRLQSAESIDVDTPTQFAKIPTSVSSPTLSDSHHNSFSYSHQLSSSDSLSQLFRELMIPGYYGNRVVAPSEGSVTDMEEEESDSGVIFTLGFNEGESEANRIIQSDDNDDDDDDNDDNGLVMGNICRAPLGTRRNYTMPDLHVVSCF